MGDVIPFPVRERAPVKTLHLMTQRGQPYGSERRCCERCGLMLRYQPMAFWDLHAWTDKPDHFHNDDPRFRTCRPT